MDLTLFLLGGIVGFAGGAMLMHYHAWKRYRRESRELRTGPSTTSGS